MLLLFSFLKEKQCLISSICIFPAVFAEIYFLNASKDMLLNYQPEYLFFNGYICEYLHDSPHTLWPWQMYVKFHIQSSCHDIICSANYAINTALKQILNFCLMVPLVPLFLDPWVLWMCNHWTAHKRVAFFMVTSCAARQLIRADEHVRTVLETNWHMVHVSEFQHDIRLWKYIYFPQFR